LLLAPGNCVGRKLFNRSVVYDRLGNLVGVAEASWISISIGPGMGRVE
jgi:hypothetical protein